MTPHSSRYRFTPSGTVVMRDPAEMLGGRSRIFSTSADSDVDGGDQGDYYFGRGQFMRETSPIEKRKEATAHILQSVADFQQQQQTQPAWKEPNAVLSKDHSDAHHRNMQVDEDGESGDSDGDTTRIYNKLMNEKIRTQSLHRSLSPHVMWDLDDVVTLVDEDCGSDSDSDSEGESSAIETAVPSPHVAIHKHSVHRGSVVVGPRQRHIQRATPTTKKNRDSLTQRMQQTVKRKFIGERPKRSVSDETKVAQKAQVEASANEELESGITRGSMSLNVQGTIAAETRIRRISRRRSSLLALFTGKRRHLGRTKAQS